MYPFVHGKTWILPTGTVGLNDCVQRCGEGQTIVLPEHAEYLGPQQGGYPPRGSPDNRWSHKYQWLPADFMTPEESENA